MLRRVALVIAVAIVALIGWVSANRYFCQELVGQIGTSKDQSIAQVSHSLWNELLGRYVDDRGRVNYREWSKSPDDRAALLRYLADAGQIDRSRSVDVRYELAYWINVYNALTVHGILERYPTRSILDHVNPLTFHFWEDLRIGVDDQWISLDAIEHQILRRLGEPRIHFALVCASVGCPPLRNEAYTAQRLEEQLTDNTREFFAEPTNFEFDAQGGVVRLSPILKWYAEDFGPSPQQIRVKLAQLGGHRLQFALLTKSAVQIEYLPYDWSLNENRP